MPLARVIRHSPLYLYLKLYSLSTLVTLFASAPVTRRLNREHLQWIEQIRWVAEDAFQRRAPAGSDDAYRGRSSDSSTSQSQDEASQVGRRREKQLRTRGKRRPSKERPLQLAYPYALKTLASDVDTKFPAFPLQTVYQKVVRVVRRWARRYTDLSEVKRAVLRDQEDEKRFPELLLPAQVRCSQGPHPQEMAYIEARSRRIIESTLLRELVGCRGADTLRWEDVPTLAIGGSGGGYRATFGFMASLQALQRQGMLDAAHWLAGVSGSCWTIASLYTIGTLDVDKAVEHSKRVAREGFHPMSRQALDGVARSRKGVYFLLAPLLSKVKSGVVGIGVMDMYATLTTSYQLLSRSPHARPRLSRSTFQFSKMWERAGLSEGRAPMPIFTAVRIKHEKKKGRRRTTGKAEIHAGDAPFPLQRGLPAQFAGDGQNAFTSSNLDREKDALQARRTAFEDADGSSRYQWWEMNPLEIGSSDEGAWVPAWAYGRSFDSGRSTSTAPEISLSLLLGQATSAPAGPLTGYISTMLATLPQGTIMANLLFRMNKFVQWKRWERRWGNPIRGADEPNPLRGHGHRLDGRGDDALDQEWEERKRIKLMDSGLSNNLPNHIFTSAARQADIIVSFDQSSDVQTGAALSRLNDFALQRNLVLVGEKDLPELEPHPPDKDAEKDGRGKVLRKDLTSAEIETRFRGRYAQVFRGWYRNKLSPQEQDWQAGRQDGGPSSAAHFYLIYCPLLPHPSQPGYDPVTAPFSTSYNLVWSPEEIDVIAKTAASNAIDHVLPALKRVYRSMYESKRARRESACGAVIQSEGIIDSNV